VVAEAPIKGVPLGYQDFQMTLYVSNKHFYTLEQQMIHMAGDALKNYAIGEFQKK